MSRSFPLTGLIVADSISWLGNQVAAVALPVLILQYTHSAILTGIAAAANVLPMLLAAVFGGRAIDRIGAWNVSLASDILSFLSVLALPLCFLNMDTVPPVLIVFLVLGGAMFDPSGASARQTLVKDLAARAGKPLESVNAWRGGLENGADFAGPMIAVALIGLLGVTSTFFVNAASFLLCAVLFAVAVPRGPRIKQPAAETSSIRGFRFIMADPVLFPLALLGAIASFAILPFLALFLPLLATVKFDQVALLGISVSIFGLAATGGAIGFGWLSRHLTLTTIFYGGLTLSGLAVAFAGLAEYQWQVVLAAALGGLLLGAGNPLEQTLMQRRVPGEIAGQVFTAMTAIRFVGGPIGLLVGGMASEWVSTEFALLFAGALLTVSALAGWWSWPLKAPSPQ